MSEDYIRPPRRRRPLPLWVRLGLVLLVTGWVAVFAVAVSLNPYDDRGTARTMETHRQLGLPPCNFKEITGAPCPSCGMTTSFALLVRGDVWSSLLANCAGTALATLGLVFVPWGLACAVAGRFVLVRSLETLAFRLCMVFLVLLFGRWGLVLLLNYGQ
jgi:ABC-type sugar transport system permease subunit